MYDCFQHPVGSNMFGIGIVLPLLAHQVRLYFHIDLKRLKRK